MQTKIDGDALLSQALTGLLLAGYVALGYVAVLGVFNAAPLSHPDIYLAPPWWQNIIAIVAITLTIWPVYRWLRSRVRSVVYSHDDAPFPALAQLNRRLQSAPAAPDTIHSMVAESVAQMLKLPYVRIETRVRLGAETAGPEAHAPLVGEFGAPPRGAAITHTPLVYHNAPIGELQAAARRMDEPLSDGEIRLLHDLAQHLGVTLYAAQLTGDLQRARERLVIAREEERRRIRNDLHDGLAPTLSSLQLQLGLLQGSILTEPQQAQALIAEMRHDLHEATAEIRRLVYDLRPPMLDELGLAGALQNIKFPDPNTCFEVDLPAEMPELSAAMEVAIYRIASEAVHNVVKHARADTCSLSMTVHAGLLDLQVCDDGQSFGEGPRAGVGLRSMRERAAELGGTLSVRSRDGEGTCVTAVFPIGM